MNPVIVWRGKSHESFSLHPVNLNRTICPYCNQKLFRNENLENSEELEFLEYYLGSDDIPSFYNNFEVYLNNGGYSDSAKCLFCGWYFIINDGGYGPSFNITELKAELRNFNINSNDLKIKEVISHLKNNYTDIYNISWSKYEKVVESVYKEHGYNCVRTQLTRDGGADILVFGKNNKITSIIECKKNSKNRKIGIGLIRSVVGACIDWEVNRVDIVTTSFFTDVAKNKAENYAKKNFEINLVDATAFLKMLNVYDDQYPPLHNMTKELRKQIVEANRNSLL